MEMKSIISYLFILQAIINGVNLVIAKPPRDDMLVCKGDEFKSNTIEQNRDTAFKKLLASFKNSSYHGFYHTQAGDKSEEQVSASVLCPPIVHVGLCECCAKNVTPYLVQKCPKQNEGVAWDTYPYVTCILRYSVGRKILSVLDDWAWYNYTNPENHVKAVDLEKTFDSMTSKLKEEAAGGDGVKKYAQGSAIYDGEENTLFMSMQCSPDLGKEDCVKCLSKASSGLRGSCVEKRLFYGRAFSTNCQVWYDHVTYFDPPAEYSTELCA